MRLSDTRRKLQLGHVRRRVILIRRKVGQAVSVIAVSIGKPRGVKVDHFRSMEYDDGQRDQMRGYRSDEGTVASES
jgi:hypothetical protein